MANMPLLSLLSSKYATTVAISCVGFERPGDALAVSHPNPERRDVTRGAPAEYSGFVVHDQNGFRHYHLFDRSRDTNDHNSTMHFGFTSHYSYLNASTGSKLAALLAG